jgi:hypothetical protein
MQNSGVSDLYSLWLYADPDSGFLINPTIPISIHSQAIFRSEN